MLKSLVEARGRTKHPIIFRTTQQGSGTWVHVRLPRCLNFGEIIGDQKDPGASKQGGEPRWMVWSLEENRRFQMPG